LLLLAITVAAAVSQNIDYDADIVLLMVLLVTGVLQMQDSVSEMTIDDKV